MKKNKQTGEADFPAPLQPFLISILNAAADGITAQDKTGKLIYANATAAKIIGYASPQALLDAPIAEIMNNFEVFDEAGNPFPLSRLPGRLVLEGQESPAVILRFRTKATNVERWSSVHSSGVYNEKNELEFVVNTFRDVTDLRATEAELIAREELYRELVENANDLIFSLDLEGNFLSLNSLGETLTGYTYEEILAIPLQELVFSEDRAIVESLLGQELSANERRNYELTIRRKDGQALVLEINTSTLLMEGIPYGVQVIGRDISKRKQLEARQLFLAEASTILAASLDYETTLITITKLMTPRIADWSGVDIVTEKGILQRVAVSHVDPDKVAWAYELRKAYPVDLNAETGLSNVLRTGVSEFYPDIPDEMLVAASRNPEHLKIMRDVGFRSAIIVALSAHGKIFGALSLVATDDSGRHFSSFDLLLAEEIGRIAGLVIENALSYRQTEVERERLRVTLTSIGDAVIATDIEGNVEFLNTVAEKLTGWSYEEAIGRPLSEIFYIINELSREVVENPVDKVLETGHIVGLANHTILITRDGHEMPIEDSAAPIRSHDNEIKGVVLVFRDATNERIAQAALETARNMAEFAAERLSQLHALSSVLSGAATMQEIAQICIRQSLESLGVSTASIALFRNEGTVLEVVENSPKSLSGQVFQEVPLDSSLPLVDTAKTGRAIWLSSAESFQKLYPDLFEDKVKKFKSQSYVSLPLRIEDRIIGSIGFNFMSPQRFDEDERAFILAMTHQCSQALERARLYESEMEAREAAEKANQLKMQFLAMISHELRTPLTAIKGFTTTLLAKDVKFSSEQQENFLNVLDEETDKMTNLVEQLMDLSLLQSGTLRIEPIYQPFENIVAVANKELEKLTENRHLVVYITKNLPPAWADTNRIAQVLINLVSNAVKFSFVDTYITIVVAQVGNRLQIDVSDEGIGIPRDERSSVFEAFRQSGRKSSSKGQGAGLSLAICKAIVEAHNGEIWLQDKVIGTTISFNLPYAQQ